jgi:hypothetical protein
MADDQDDCSNQNELREPLGEIFNHRLHG